ncbi:MAG: hypothetical protein RJA09_1746 [Pseudomonadota bacterium]
MATLYRQFAMTTAPDPHNDTAHMALALKQAQLAAEAGEVPVGAVVVRAGVVVAVGHNRTVTDHDPSAHAEIVALRLAGQRLGNHRLADCDLYVTLEPCAMCAQAVAHARIRRLVYGAPEPRTGAAGSVIDLLGDRRLNPHTQVVSGVAAAPSVSLLQAFFEQRRQQARARATPLREDALRTPESVFATWGALWPGWSALQAHSHHTTGLPVLNGLRLHHMDKPATAEGAGEPPWLCLHDPKAWWPQWADWLEHPPGGRRVLVPDLVGCGQSDKPKKAAWHSLATHGRVLLDWLEHLALDRVVLVVAPGQLALARTLHSMAPARAAWDGGVEHPDTAALPGDWRQVPYPDRGHRAAWSGWCEE